MNKPKVFITRKRPDSVEAKLKQHYDVTLNVDDRPLIAEKFKSALQGVVNTQALIESLRNKRIAGAGLDVYEGEPNVCLMNFLTLNNVSHLSHLGSATLSTRTAMGEKALSFFCR